MKVSESVKFPELGMCLNVQSEKTSNTMMKLIHESRNTKNGY